MAGILLFGQTVLFDHGERFEQLRLNRGWQRHHVFGTDDVLIRAVAQ
jgi:hypothetical protein